jgi:uncharacterized protein YggE
MKGNPMKYRIFLILAALAAAPGSPALADPVSRTIAMSGQGEIRAVPDMVTLSAGVTVQAATAAAALAADNNRMQAVMTALKKQGVADKNIQTSQFSVSPQYANTDGQAPRLTGYQVTNEVSVRLDDVSKLGATLDALVTAGANQMNGINFSIADTAALMAQARQQAVADALNKAQTYAKAAGVTLGAIQSISESDNGGPRPLYAAAPMAMARAVPVAMGEERVTATVSIVWQIQ